MAVCPNCGTVQKTSAGTIIAWCVGIFAVGLFALPVIVVMLLAAIAAIGADANEKFSQADTHETFSHVTNELSEHPAAVTSGEPTGAPAAHATN